MVPASRDLYEGVRCVCSRRGGGGRSLPWGRGLSLEVRFILEDGGRGDMLRHTFRKWGTVRVRGPLNKSGLGPAHSLHEPWRGRSALFQPGLDLRMAKVKAMEQWEARLTVTTALSVFDREVLRKASELLPGGGNIKPLGQKGSAGVCPSRPRGLPVRKPATTRDPTSRLGVGLDWWEGSGPGRRAGRGSPREPQDGTRLRALGPRRAHV